MSKKPKHEITIRSAAAQELSLMNNKDSKIDEYGNWTMRELVNGKKVVKK